MGLLTNIFFRNGLVHLVYRKDGVREIVTDSYTPYFYVVSSDPQYHCNVISGHPYVISAVIEEKYYGPDPLDAIRVSCNYWQFEQLVKDLRVLDAEFAETGIPHYLKYMHDRKLRFFAGQMEDVVYSGGNDRDADVILGTFGKRYDEPIYLQIERYQDIYHEESESPSEKLMKVMELSRITGAKADDVLRLTPGALNNFLHTRSAWNSNAIMPDKKLFLEKPKTLRELERVDRGGTIFYPRPGIYYNVAKCDFASLYPSIIVKYGISPEGRNIVPEGIREVLETRLHLKKMMNTENDPRKKRIFSIRQRALKNILVTCFGYLGFKNFIFSNVECKEEVVMRGRMIMEETKHIAESFGLDVIYGIVDSVFVCGQGDFVSFAEDVSRRIGIVLELDCIFDYIAFPEAENGSGIANKYYGITGSGIEARGISMRHSDAPRFIKRFQERVILDLRNHAAIFRSEMEMIEQNPMEDFAITKRIRREIYHSNPPHVVASRFQEKSGSVTFVYTSRGPRPIAVAQEIDYPKYRELLRRSYDELIRGIFNY